MTGDLVPVDQPRVLVCERYDLDPLLKHLQLIKGAIYVTRDGFLHVAHRSGVFDGMQVLDEGETDTYYYAKVAVYRKDMTRPFIASGRCKKSENVFGERWDMALTRAERRALKRAFDVAGLPSEGDYEEIPDVVRDVGGTGAERADAPALASPVEPAAPDPIPEPVEVPPVEREVGPSLVDGSTPSTTAPPAPDDPPLPDVAPPEVVTPPDEWDLEAMKSALGKMTPEFLDLLRAAWKNAGLPKPESIPDGATYEQAWKLVRSWEIKQKDALATRRKRANALMQEIGVKGDRERHEFIHAATNGETESTAALTAAQIEAVVTAVEAYKAKGEAA